MVTPDERNNSTAREAAIRARDALFRDSTEPSARDVSDVLVPVWNSLKFERYTKLTAQKLWRLETPSWKAPVLTFVMERHGGTMMGSSRADKYRVTVDLRAGAVSEEKSGYRQIRRRSSPLEV